jgi:hypothetical protein
LKRRSANRLFLALSLIGLIVIAGLPFAGWVRWSLASERPIDLLVYDSTVFDDQRREHHAIGLMMTYLKVPFNGATDYVGSSPGGLPFGTWPRERPDLVLLVDAYGVYVNELADVDANGTVRISQTFPPSFARDVVRWAGQGTVVMAEFNVMHEPTDPGTSEMLQALFGIDATGWVGRSFEDLQDASPRLQSLHAGAWDFQGPGIVIVGTSVGTRTRDPALVVLQAAQLESPRPRVTGNLLDESEELDISFDSWFALIEADSGADTQLWINLPVNDRGADLLEEWGIAHRSPFLVWNDNTVYAAGNLASTPAAFPARHIAGALPVLKYLAADGNAALFYRVYAPLVERLVQMADR